MESTRTYKMVLAYNGTNFKGWQRGNGRTVQSTLEEAVEQSLADASGGVVDEPLGVKVDGAGRTDAGVHAEGQVASVALPSSVEPGLLLANLDRHLPSDMAVLSVEVADPRFHARYRARAKTYRYRIVDGAVGDPFLNRFSLRIRDKLDPGLMESAAELFVGEHDFSAFTADKGSKDKTRTIFSIELTRPSFFWGSPIDILLRGNGFLWKQVRIMVSAILSAGTGETEVSALKAILESGDRSLAPGPAPARGLTLVSVEYGSGESHGSG